MQNGDYDKILAECATCRETEVGKLFLRLLELEADKRLRGLEHSDERNFARVQGGIHALRELRTRIG
jgi:hypothetical protein